jgi:hypothetical protein
MVAQMINGHIFYENMRKKGLFFVEFVTPGWPAIHLYYYNVAVLNLNLPASS